MGIDGSSSSDRSTCCPVYKNTKVLSTILLRSFLSTYLYLYLLRLRSRQSRGRGSTGAESCWSSSSHHRADSNNSWRTINLHWEDQTNLPKSSPSDKIVVFTLIQNSDWQFILYSMDHLVPFTNNYLNIWGLKRGFGEMPSAFSKSLSIKTFEFYDTLHRDRRGIVRTFKFH